MKEMSHVNKLSRKISVYFVDDDEKVVFKKCSKCENILGIEEFYKKPSGIGGKSAECKSCNKASRRRYHYENRSKNLQRMKSYNEEHREEQVEYHRKYRVDNAEIISTRRKQYYSNNRKIILQKSHEYYQSNKDRISVIGKEWSERNRDKTLIYDHRRRCKEKGVEMSLMEGDLMRLREEQNYKCPVTGKSNNLHLEHFIPLDWGVEGTSYDNCYFIDGEYNSKKSVKNPFDWADSLQTPLKDSYYEDVIQIVAKRRGLTVQELRLYVSCIELMSEYVGRL